MFACSPNGRPPVLLCGCSSQERDLPNCPPFPPQQSPRQVPGPPLVPPGPPVSGCSPVAPSRGPPSGQQDFSDWGPFSTHSVVPPRTAPSLRPGLSVPIAQRPYAHLSSLPTSSFPRRPATRSLPPGPTSPASLPASRGSAAPEWPALGLPHQVPPPSASRGAGPAPLQAQHLLLSAQVPAGCPPPFHRSGAHAGCPLALRDPPWGRRSALQLFLASR